MNESISESTEETVEERRAREKAEREALKARWAETEAFREEARARRENESSGSFERRITVEIIRKSFPGEGSEPSRDQAKTRDFAANYTTGGTLGETLECLMSQDPQEDVPGRGEIGRGGVGLEVRYVNYRGEAGLRRIVPNLLRYGATEYHPEPDWLLECFDLDKRMDRVYALKDCDFRALDEVRGAAGAGVGGSLSGRRLSAKEQALVEAHLQTMDGNKWAEAFALVARSLGYPEMDQGWLVGWFCNAIMKGWDTRDLRAQKEAGKVPGWESLIGKGDRVEWIEKIRKQAVNELEMSAGEMEAVEAELAALEQNMKIGAFGAGMSPRLMQLMNAMGVLIATGSTGGESSSSGGEVEAELGDVSSRLGEAIPAEEVSALVEKGKEISARALESERRWVEASGDADWGASGDGRRFWVMEGGSLSEEADSAEGRASGGDESRRASGGNPREEVVDRLVVRAEYGSGKLDMREPILLHGATSTVDNLFSVLLAECGLTKLEQLAERIGEEAYRRKNEWLNSAEKVQAAGVQRKRLNRVRVLWGDNLQYSVVVSDEEAIMQGELTEGILHCPQARSDDDAFAFGKMFLFGKQDPEEYPLIP